MSGLFGLSILVRWGWRAGFRWMLEDRDEEFDKEA
jgi:hypothetical protein